MNTKKYDKLMDRNTFAMEALDRVRESISEVSVYQKEKKTLVVEYLVLKQLFVKKDLKIIEKSLSKMWRAIDKEYECRGC